jgi:hypothetical protein
MKMNRREWVRRQADPRFAVFETVSYSRSTGGDMIRFRWGEEADDIFGSLSLAYSTDHGRTWEEGAEWPAGEKRPEGVHREYWMPPVTVGGRLLLLGASGVFRNDHALDGMTQYVPRYRVSDDGGRTWAVDEPVIQAGPGLDAAHPFPDVWVGRNSVMPANVPIVLKDGRVLVPCNVTVLDPEGRYFCPPGAYTYTAAGVLEGRWQADGRLAWKLAEPVRIKPEQSLRGAIEPTLAEMPDGRILMVLRANAGSVDPNSGFKWFSLSGDHGRTWSRPWPWTFSDGTPFFSPSSISLLTRHSSGDWFWIGNICPDSPSGNSPRYPLVIGRVDPLTLRLEMESLDVIDTRQEGDTERLQLSNFALYEDRQTGDMVLRLTRRDGGESGGAEPIQASVMAYTFDL